MVRTYSLHKTEISQRLMLTSQQDFLTTLVELGLVSGIILNVKVHARVYRASGQRSINGTRWCITSGDMHGIF